MHDISKIPNFKIVTILAVVSTLQNTWGTRIPRTH